MALYLRKLQFRMNNIWFPPVFMDKGHVDRTTP